MKGRTSENRDSLDKRGRRPRNATRPERLGPEYGARDGYLASPLVDIERRIVDIEVVPELCMSFLNCMRIATGAFARQRATGRTGPSRWQQVEQARLWKAAWSCPTGAIRFVTEQGYLNPRWEEAVRWRTEAHAAAGRRRAPRVATEEK